MPIVHRRFNTHFFSCVFYDLLTDSFHSDYIFSIDVLCAIEIKLLLLSQLNTLLFWRVYGPSTQCLILHLIGMPRRACCTNLFRCNVINNNNTAFSANLTMKITAWSACFIKPKLLRNYFKH